MSNITALTNSLTSRGVNIYQQARARLGAQKTKSFSVSARGLVFGQKPNFIGIGAAKAGTTSIARLLNKHPQISFPVNGTKELHFFDDPQNMTWWKIRQYLGHFPKNKAVGEFTPSYLFVRECRDRIYRVLGPNVRFIVALRNPVDRAFAHYCHAVRNWSEPKWQKRGYPEETLGFMEAIRTEPERLAEGKYHIRHQSYFSKGLYAQQLKWYFERFPRDNFYIYLLESFASSPKVVLKDVCRFLGVDESHEFHDVGRKLNAQTDRTISRDDRAALVRQYAPSIRELEDLIDLDLSDWMKVD